MSNGPYHNIQQLSDAVTALEDAGTKQAQNDAALFLSQVSPLAARVTSLESLVAKLQADLAAVVGPAPAK